MKTFSSVKKRFINNNLYKAKTETLINDLGITTAEQVELEVLRYFPKKEQKPKKPSIESLKPWLDEGISRRTWYRHKNAELEALKIEKAKKEKISTLSPKMAAKIEEIFIKNFASQIWMNTGIRKNGTTFSYIMRGRKRLIINNKGSDKKLERERDVLDVLGVCVCSCTCSYNYMLERERRKRFNIKIDSFFYYRTFSLLRMIRRNETTLCKEQAVKNNDTGPNRHRFYAFLVRPPPRYEGGNRRLIKRIKRKEVLL